MHFITYKMYAAADCAFLRHHQCGGQTRYAFGLFTCVDFHGIFRMDRGGPRTKWLDLVAIWITVWIRTTIIRIVIRSEKSIRSGNKTSQQRFLLSYPFQFVMN